VPDLITHTVLGYFLVRRWRHAAYAFLFLIGNMMPDLMTRPFYIMYSTSYWWVYPLHTPLGALVVCWGLTGLFNERDRRPVFLALAGGSMAHFALDMLQKHAGMGYVWFMPFSWGFTDWGLFRPEDALRWLPVSVGIVAVAEILLRTFRSKVRPPKDTSASGGG